MFENGLAQDLEKTLEMPDTGTDAFYGTGGDDSMYEEAKRVVTESKKASASLLQRRLRIGYARAARLLDMLEEKGVIGPGEGAKPREVYLAGSQPFNVPPLEDNEPKDEEVDEEGEEWKKV
jgi:S-DNA-T family DNA segregation ATPase FtsK/SpoIIIE